LTDKITFVMENIVVAVSNFPAIYPINTAFIDGDFWTAVTIGYVTVASFISHLFENHKHGMPGVLSLWNIYPPPIISYVLNRLDVIGAGMTMARFGYLYYSKYGTSTLFFLNHPYFTLSLIATFCLLIISEYDKFNPDLKKSYIITHCLWHICIFTIMDWFLCHLNRLN